MFHKHCQISPSRRGTVHDSPTFRRCVSKTVLALVTESLNQNSKVLCYLGEGQFIARLPSQVSKPAIKCETLRSLYSLNCRRLKLQGSQHQFGGVGGTRLWEFQAWGGKEPWDAGYQGRWRVLTWVREKYYY